MTALRRLALLLCAWVLAGCAGTPFNAMSLQVGTPRDQVVERLGRPTAAVPIPGGERLQYSLEPFGRHVWMVDLDAAGRVARVRDVMQPAEFDRIVPGQWTAADVQREFGPPAMVDRVANWPGPILAYRWEDAFRSPMWYWVYLDSSGVVRRAHPGMEFLNAPNDKS